MTQTGRPPTPTVERFWPKVGFFPGDCWEWNGMKSTQGYGRLWDGSKVIQAHRFAYVQEYGEIPKKLTIDHLCRNRSCVNPLHLEAVTNRENILRGISPPAINARAVSCKWGHALSLRGDGHRFCAECNRARVRVAQRKKHAPEG